jgi:peptide/nickel transport system substrate-binding protein
MHALLADFFSNSLRPTRNINNRKKLELTIERLNRIAIWMFAWGILLGLAACTYPSRDTLRFGLSSAPITLDPRFATDAASSRINRLLYRRLIDFNDDFLPVPALATWRQLSPLHYEFVLGKDGRIFHDGSLLTSKDVKATYDFILNPQNASPRRTVLAIIERIEAPDDHTIHFYLNRTDPLFPARLSIGILPAGRMDFGHDFNRSPIGSGPFAFLDWPDDARLRLTRLKDGQIFEFLHVPDPTVRVLKLMRGEIDMLQNDLPPELIRHLAKNETVQVIKGQGSNFTYLGFNMIDKVVGRLEVRRAIAHALDREAIVEYVLGGAARPASALLPANHWAGNPALSFYSYDPEKARALLREEGFNDENPAKITYKTSNDPFRIRLATIIQNQLSQVGIDVDLRSYDWGTFYGDIKVGRFQMYSLSWVGIKTPDIFRTVFHSRSVPPNGANRGRFMSAVADRLIETAEFSSDLKIQSVHYRDLQAYLLDQLPYVPLWYEDHVFIAKRDLVGYQLAVDGNYDSLANVSIKRAGLF